MLEEEIVKLKSAIIELTAVILNLQETGPKQTKTKAPEPKPKEKEAAPPDDTEALRKKLQDLCLALVRKDPASNKAKIKEIIASHGGELIKDVSIDKLPSLQKALEAL